MVMSIIYLISAVTLITVFMLINKSNKKQNVLLWVFMSIMFFFCYNSIIVYILSTCYIKSTLLILSIINIIVSILLFIFFIKNKATQKYYLEKIDIITVILILVLVIIIGYFRFGFPFKIVYETVDPGTHFWKCMDFFRESILLNKASTAIDFSSRVFASYVNVGILFKMSEPFVGYIDLYAVYIVYDLFMLFMSGILFYFLIKFICKNKNYWVIIISSILYMLGYPLNNLIFGFFYLGHTVILINILLLIFKLYNNKELNIKYTLFFITLLNIGICFTYYLHMPAIFLAEIIYFIYEFKYIQNLNRNIILKRLALMIILPSILTLHYFVIPYIGSNQQSAFYQLKLDGYFYNSWLSNFIVFLPFIAYYIINVFKKKQITFEICLFFLIVGFILLIIILSIFNIAVHYYSSKFFYILWLLCFVLIFEMFNLKSITPIFKNLYFITFIILFFFSALHIEDKLFDSETLSENKLESSNILDVYAFNVEKITQPIITFTIEEIAMLRELYNMNATNVINNFNIEFNQQKIWLNAFFWTEKMNYPENELFDYITRWDYFFDPLTENGYYKMKAKYNYYLILYRDISGLKYKYYPGVIPFSIQSRWDENYRRDHTISNKEKYDKIPKNSCPNCTFVEFDAGMIVIKN